MRRRNLATTHATKRRAPPLGLAQGDRQKLAAAAGPALGQISACPEHRLSEVSAKVLGKLLAQPGALSRQHTEEATKLALQRVHEMDGKDCVRLVRGVVQHGTADQLAGGGLRRLGERLSAQLQETPLPDLVDLAESLAAVPLPAAIPVFAQLSSAISLRAGMAKAPELAKVAGAFSKVRLADRQLFPRLAQSSVKQLHLFSGPDLSAFLAAFATVGIGHEVLLTAAVKPLLARSSQLSALDLALVAYAYAQFSLVYPALVTMLRKRLPLLANQLPSLRLAELAVSCARLDIREPALLTIFACHLDLGGLSAPLLGQVSKSLAQLGITAAPRLRRQLEEAFWEHLHPTTAASAAGSPPSYPHTVLLDLLECLGESAKDGRISNGGVWLGFLRDTLPRLAVAVARFCPSFAPEEVAAAYRALRQLPPSSAIPSETSVLWAVHESLAARAVALSAVDAFSPEELTSALFSQVCLFPDLWVEEANAGAVNPRRSALQQSLAQVSSAWSARSPAFPAENPDLQRQAAFLHCLFSGREACVQQPHQSQREAPFVSAESGESESHSAAMELLKLLEGLGTSLEAKGPRRELGGLLEVHATVGTLAFCLLPEAAHFRRPGSSAFQEPHGEEAPWSLGRELAGGFELCLERLAELWLLQKQGWTVAPVPFHEWRRLSQSQRAGRVGGTLQLHLLRCSSEALKMARTHWGAAAARPGCCTGPNAMWRRARSCGAVGVRPVCKSNPWRLPQRTAQTGRPKDMGPSMQQRCGHWLQRMRSKAEAAAAAAATLGRGEEIQARWQRVNRRFDNWFNAQVVQLQQEVRDRWSRSWRRLQERAASSLKSDSKPVPFDCTATLLMGAGAGSALQGYWQLGSFLALCGAARGIRRFAVQKLDDDDLVGLFRWTPRWLCKDRGAAFQWLKSELYAIRKLRGGDTAFLEATYKRKPLGHVFDPGCDHTPESLFEEAMASLAAHQRVKEVLGLDIHPRAEPDKVVYRIHEGVSEVFLSWQIVGRLGSAEVQVKATASIVDFIYVFPQSGDRYGFQRPGFVIRPTGNWSMDCSELPKDLKQPFGEHGGRIYKSREGIFEYDYEVRDFRHGFEDHPRRKRR